MPSSKSEHLSELVKRLQAKQTLETLEIGEDKKRRKCISLNTTQEQSLAWDKIGIVCRIGYGSQ